MGFQINKFDGGEVDFFSARDLASNQFQVFKNVSGKHMTRMIKCLGQTNRTVVKADSFVIPGQGFLQYRSEWDDEPRQASTLFRIASRIVNSAGAWEINIHKNDAKNDDTGSFGTEFIDETSAKGGWERATSNRLVQGASNITFTASTGRISGHANLENYEVGEIIRVFNTTDNNGYFVVKTKAPAANSVDVQETLTDESNVSAYLYPLPFISMYAINGALRLSNGNFYDDHKSLWYGHIKRDFWGQGVTYGSAAGRYSQPPMKEAYNNWRLEDQELVAPIVSLSNGDGYSYTTSPNEIKIGLPSYSGNDNPSGWPEKATGVEWNGRDRVTCTYIYDFVQESALGKTSDGAIGVEIGSLRAALNSDDARPIALEVYTGASNVSWNRRITAIKLYYKFYDDPDWYEVAYFDVKNGWKDSDKIFDTENTGYWVPLLASIGSAGTTDASGGSGTTVNIAGHSVSADEGFHFNTHNVLYAGLVPKSLRSVVSSITANTVILPITPIDAAGNQKADYNSVKFVSGPIADDAVGTFFVPFTGEKDFSYFTNSGRSSKLKVPATRWGAADTDGSKVLIGNIDTLDDNEQTIRERSRVIETPEGMPDTFLLTKSKDVGLNLGDEIIAIKYFNALWWVMMERNIVVLQPGSLREVKRWFGRGCKWPNASAITPYGLAVADESRISLFPTGEELTLLKQAAYQSLTFFQSVMGYSMDEDELYFVPDTTGTEMWVFSFRLKSWRRQTLPSHEALSNFISSSKYNEPEILHEDASYNVRVKQLNGGTSDETGLIQTQDIVLGHEPLTVRNVFISYISSSVPVTVKIYLDNQTDPYKTMTMAASSTLVNKYHLLVNTTSEVLSMSFESTATDFTIEDIEIPDSEIIGA